MRRLALLVILAAMLATTGCLGYRTNSTPYYSSGSSYSCSHDHHYGSSYHSGYDHGHHGHHHDDDDHHHRHH